ncbi:MAG: dihydrodipicolinate reductase, partial [Mycobacterium sp.]|nr:dihydrodipicolinate reductase [Mycobacterium sp.]
MRRVIQFSTGNVGRHALRTIIDRPDLELVGVHASGAQKVGRDAAELCGLTTPSGVVATDDIDALVGLHADCVVYTSQAETRPGDAIDEISRFLAGGTNVVGTSMVWLVAPEQADDWLRDPLERACKAGDASLYINGIDPGFSGDTLVYTALSLSARATAITVQEIFDYGSYDDAEFTGVSMGFATTPDHTPIMFQPGVLTSLWGGQVRSLADGLGVELDDVRERHETWATPEPIESAMMTVAPGRVAAVRFAVEGVRAGMPVVTMEHVDRLTEVTGPDWPYPPDRRPGVHRVT